MSSDILKGQWKQIKGSVQKNWGKLTNDEVDQIQGDSNKLIGKLQEKYGYTRSQAESEVNKFLNKHNFVDQNAQNQ